MLYYYADRKNRCSGNYTGKYFQKLSSTITAELYSIKNLTGISLRYRYKSPVIACPGNQYRKNPISAQLHKDVVL